MNKYVELKDKHQTEVNNFPMAFAFSDEQFIEGMEKLGLRAIDTDKVISIGGGGFIRKSDRDKKIQLFEKLEKQMQEAIAADTTGEGFIKDMFAYELGNHEYCITYELEPTLDVLGVTVEEINNSPKLLHGLNVAKNEYLKECNE